MCQDAREPVYYLDMMAIAIAYSDFFIELESRRLFLVGA
jgi:hypothetical protein